MSIITEYLECVSIEMKTQSKTCNKKTIVGVVYRQPNTCITAFTEHVINIIQTRKVDNRQCYILVFLTKGYELLFASKISLRNIE